jgi:hypothetical protein
LLSRSRCSASENRLRGCIKPLASNDLNESDHGLKGEGFLRVFR